MIKTEEVDKIVATVQPINGPKRKPFANRKQTIGADAGEWIIKNVDGKKVFVAV
jgi:hypothetical protein